MYVLGSKGGGVGLGEGAVEELLKHVWVEDVGEVLLV